MYKKTERLTIRPVKEEDWRAIQQIWVDFNQSPYWRYDNYKCTEDDSVRKRIALWAEKNRTGKDPIFLAVCLQDLVIGFYSLNGIPQGYEIGYGFMDRYQGNGYAKESLAAVLELAGELGAKRIEAGTALENYPSVGLLKSQGFKLVQTEWLAFFKDSNGNPLTFKGGIFEFKYDSGVLAAAWLSTL